MADPTESRLPAEIKVFLKTARCLNGSTHCEAGNRRWREAGQGYHSRHAGISRMARMNEFFAEAPAASKFMAAAGAGRAVADPQ
jgi:hypothetical protein